LEAFPIECEYVIEKLAEVYTNERIVKELKMTPVQRLKYHQEKSSKVMNELKVWLEEQFEMKKVEPNSSLGGAIKYMIKHWQQLTLFLRMGNAPLDSNIVERSLKMAILNRKNAYFNKTETGAYGGDIFMSVIQTCKMHKVNAYEYLTILQKHSISIKEKPYDWLPWNYKKAMAELNS
jgi:transposase